MPPKSKQVAAGVPAGVPPKPDNRILPTKEQAVFRTLLQLFEQKEFKKGLKTAETLLKNHPEHGGRLQLLFPLSNALAFATLQTIRLLEGKK